MRKPLHFMGFLAVVTTLAASAVQGAPLGYYRQPAMVGETILFVAEGDLWKVRAEGGVATRLTSHLGEEGQPAVAPDGKNLAFVARYEGSPEVYLMPIDGGLPRRLTFDAFNPTSIGWTPPGQILAASRVRSTLPSMQLWRIDPRDGTRTQVPLAEAAGGSFDSQGKTLIFTRLPFQGSFTKRYRGGTAQNLWRYSEGDNEARPLTANYPGTSRSPMWWNGRVYFATDRDGTMNLWSMRPDGSNPTPHTRHKGLDVGSPSLAVGSGRIVYQLGADLRLYDIAKAKDREIPIRLDSDFDQTRERWVAKPVDYLTHAHVNPKGTSVVLTARGRVFVVPKGTGRLVEAARNEGVRYRDARFMPDGKTLLALSDESGEVELWTLPANGVGGRTRLTTAADVLRREALPSPDGKQIAHHDKNQRLYLYDMTRKENKKIDESAIDDFENLAWSADSRWLAYVALAENRFRQIKLYSVLDGSITPLTTDRFDSYSPAWSPDGKWIYLLSDRNLKSVVQSPWGSYQPEPFLAKKTRIYQVALTKGLRSPFAPPDELHPDPETSPDKKSADEKEKANEKEKEKTNDDSNKPKQPTETKDNPDKDKNKPTAKEAEPNSGKTSNDKPATTKPEVTPIVIDKDGLAARLIAVPIPPGDYDSLAVNTKALFWISRQTDDNKQALVATKFERQEIETKVVVPDIAEFELAQAGETILVKKADKLYLIDATPAPADLAKKELDLSAWTLSITPREEWRQMFDEAWRLERDYFYDRKMHGLNWQAIRDKYRPLVDRVASRVELSDLISQMVAELSALHIFVRGGDSREGTDDATPASLGATLVRDPAKQGYRVDHIYRTDPDEPDRVPPLARPDVAVNEGDVITMVDGQNTLDVPDIGSLLRRKAGRQVLLRINPKQGGSPRDVIARPITAFEEIDLRYHEWEFTRRLAVDQKAAGEIGYVHLRGMSGANFTEWAKGFYPVHNRKGLIIDVRHNTGGNIDSWIIGRLLRKPWFYWNPRVGKPSIWNMQYAFRGHIAVLCDQFTASDGEAFAEGIKRLGLGTVVGTRTWGGEIWLSGSNFLVDKGIATAAETGVYGPEGTWLIEGYGVDPHVVVDNLPHATFLGKDAQLDTAIDLLRKKIRENPVETPSPPPFPDKTADNAHPAQPRPKP
jgi:tricorn protease